MGDIRFRRLHDVVDEHPLGSIDDPRLLPFFQERAKLVRMQDILPVDHLPHQQRRDAVRDKPNRLAQRRDQYDPLGQDASRNAGREFYREVDRYGLGGHLPEQQQQRHHDKDVQPARVGAKQDQQNGGHVGRRGNVDQLVPAQDGNDQPARLIEQGVETLGIRMSRVPEFLKVDAAEGEERRFRS